MKSVRCVFTLLNTQGIVLYSALAVLYSTLVVLIPFGIGIFIDVLVYGGEPFLVFGSVFSIAILALLLNMLTKGMIQRIASLKVG